MINNPYYYLDENRNPVQAELVWPKQDPRLPGPDYWNFWQKRPHVAVTTVGPSTISTVFLGIDHNWGDGPPVLFETMVFGGELDQEQERYHTWAEAEAGHAAMVERVRKALRREIEES